MNITYIEYLLREFRWFVIFAGYTTPQVSTKPCSLDENMACDDLHWFCDMKVVFRWTRRSSNLPYKLN